MVENVHIPLRSWSYQRSPQRRSDMFVTAKTCLRLQPHPAGVGREEASWSHTRSHSSSLNLKSRLVSGVAAAGGGGGVKGHSKRAACVISCCYGYGCCCSEAASQPVPEGLTHDCNGR